MSFIAVPKSCAEAQKGTQTQTHTHTLPNFTFFIFCFIVKTKKPFILVGHKPTSSIWKGKKGFGWFVQKQAKTIDKKLVRLSYSPTTFISSSDFFSGQIISRGIWHLNHFMFCVF